jgi:hypothetical protein
VQCQRVRPRVRYQLAHLDTLQRHYGVRILPRLGTPAEKSFNRADVFERHLTTVHGIGQTPLNARRRFTSKRPYSTTDENIACYYSTWNNSFANSQEPYGHLDSCVLRVIQQSGSSLPSIYLQWLDYAFYPREQPGSSGASPMRSPLSSSEPGVYNSTDSCISLIGKTVPIPYQELLRIDPQRSEYAFYPKVFVSSSLSLYKISDNSSDKPTLSTELRGTNLQRISIADESSTVRSGTFDDPIDLTKEQVPWETKHKVPPHAGAPPPTPLPAQGIQRPIP